MTRRALSLLLLSCLVFILVIPVSAQAPDSINSALADLSQRVGRTVTQADLDTWTYAQSVFPDASLGCPQAGKVYAQVQTSGIQFLLTYAGTTYDYRVSSDRQIVILCSTGAAPTQSPAENCPPPNDAAYLPPRLSINTQARVVADSDIPNNVRDQPGQSARKTGEIPPGGVFTVLAGPHCTTLDKLIWWQVNYNGLIGWTVEGQAGGYWLEPLNAQGTPVPTIVAGGRITTANAGQLGNLSSLDNQAGPTALSPDSRMIVQGRADGSIVFYSTQTGRPETTMIAVSNDGVAATSIAFGPNSRALLTGDQNGTIRLWDIDLTGAVQKRVELIGHTGAINAVVFSPDGLLVASGGEDKTVRVWDATTGAALALLTGHQAAVVQVGFTPDGKTLFSVSSDGSVRLWNVQVSAG